MTVREHRTPEAFRHDEKEAFCLAEEEKHGWKHYTDPRYPDPDG